MKDKVSIFWFRRDLRLEDNAGLSYALNSGTKVLPVFIFDSEILDSLEKDDARVSFIHDALTKMQEILEKKNTSLFIKKGNPIAVFQELLEEFEIDTVYTNRDYEPYAQNRDGEIEAFLKGKNVQFLTFKDQVIFEKNEIVKSDTTAYKIFTPYSKRWKSLLNDTSYQKYSSLELKENFYEGSFQFPTLETIGFSKSNILVLPYNTSKDMVNSYEATRNIPGIDGTSKLSPHLRFGTVSVRYCVQKALQSKNETFLNELIWREFFMQILWHYPESRHQNFKRKYNGVQWRNNELEFKAWCEGNTGYPIVDAGMRELNTTGYMHNRVRMITASFLCKHLLIDWRWGEAYFASKLLDFDLAQNVGNWQWVAGTGCDSAPYFRIFNPDEQVKKFDKKFEYIKKWVPEFQELTYTRPIVDHKEARSRCLKVYKEGIEMEQNMYVNEFN